MTMSVGIEDLAVYVPRIYFPIKDLAELRQIEYAKLHRGLGLEKMSLCDVDENVATMGAEAILDLLARQDIDPAEISRIYLGTESALDSSKPTSTYMVEMIEMVYGKGAFRHCDVVDLTFACIGAVDALENCLDYIRANPNEKAIVVAADEALYEQNSTGEYTQGAGAVALLVKSQPRLMSFATKFAASMSSALDFYKPLRRLSTDLIEDKSQAQNDLDTSLDKASINVHTSTPVFDGQYSNTCYQQRIEEAFRHFCKIKDCNAGVLHTWERLIFHLPYASHARRVCQPVFIDALIAEGRLEIFCKEQGLNMELLSEDAIGFYKQMSKTPAYQSFVRSKLSDSALASSQVGNLYTASIFMALASALHHSMEEDLEGKAIGFFAYGSGSKSKVFEGRLEAGWRQAVADIRLNEKLDDRQSINTDTYLALRKGKVDAPIAPERRRFVTKENNADDYMRHAHLFATVECNAEQKSDLVGQENGRY